MKFPTIKFTPLATTTSPLKDAESSIRCVMFRREAASLRFRPENGMKVVVSRSGVCVSPGRVYQLYCNHMMPDGVGELAFAFERLKERLHREGLFDPARKKASAAYPHTIALVTSPGRGGGAGHDPHPGGPVAHGQGAGGPRPGQGRGPPRRSSRPWTW